ncbi:tumor necrosis factor receptor superfamily member 25 [Pyxicephalus adspersus]|uniref:tumor necrosis factor receptor superfamily member 25 n=1 Tax=Pyxicephalus adspersus TaxID=30357 RepID=UPI003B5B0FFC
MKNILIILLLSLVYLLSGKCINTLENQNPTLEIDKFNFSQAKLSQWSKHSRSKRFLQQCPEGQAYDDTVNHCCRKCPAGKYVKKPCAAPGQDPTCAVCEDNSYLAFPNYRSYCQRCTICDHEKQVEEAPCTAIHNRECGCKNEFYVKGDECYPCTRCINRDIKENCSKTANTICGDCLPNFFEEKNECQPCNKSSTDCKERPASCTPVCVSITTSLPDYYIAFGIFPLLFVSLLVGLFIYKYKWKKEHSLGGDTYSSSQEETTVSPNKCPEGGMLLTFQEAPVLDLCSSSTSQGHVPSVLQKGCALYDIIDCIPVKRWKELMRNLELPDNEIERVEMEVCNFRDQQYEMLRRWCQLKTASMESIYQALDHMHLSGCLEELKAKLERYSSC